MINVSLSYDLKNFTTTLTVNKDGQVTTIVHGDYINDIDDVVSVIGCRPTDIWSVTGFVGGFDYEREYHATAYHTVCNCCESCSMITQVTVKVFLNGYKYMTIDCPDVNEFNDGSEVIDYLNKCSVDTRDLEIKIYYQKED